MKYSLWSLVVVLALVGCGNGGNKRGDPGPGAGAPDGSTCTPPATTFPGDPLGDALAFDREILRVGRRDAGFESVLGPDASQAFAAGDAMTSELMRKVAAEHGITLPPLEPSTSDPGQCPPSGTTSARGATGSVKQALAQQSGETAFLLAYFFYLTALETIPAAEPLLPMTSYTVDSPPDATPSLHLVLSLEAAVSKSSATVTATWNLTTAGPAGAVVETTKAVLTGDVCPDMGGVARGRVTVSRSGATAATSGSNTYQFEADQSFGILVGEDAETIGIDVEGTASYRSRGSAQNDFAAHGNLRLNPNGGIPSGNIQFDRYDGSNEIRTLVNDRGMSYGAIVGYGTEPVAKKKWKGGICVFVKVQPTSKGVAPNETVHLEATVHQRFEDKDLDKPVVATLSGPKSITPANQPVPGPSAAFDYVAGCKDGDRGEITLKSTSNRGIAKTEEGLVFTVQGQGEGGQCENGMVFDRDKCECVCPGNGVCPEGSTWDAASATCKAACVNGKIAGLPCVYTGTSSVSGGNSHGMSMSGLRLVAKDLEGCSVNYELASGTATYLKAPTDPCSHDPMSTAATSANTRGKFKIGLAPPTLIASLATTWPATLTCNQSKSAETIAWVWLVTLGTPVMIGQPITGTTSISGQTSAFTLTPE